MKLSEITPENIAAYLKNDEAAELDLKELELMRSSAVDTMTSYTGLSKEQLDEHESLSMALLILVADFYDNRNLYIDTKSTSLNQSVKRILGMYSRNLL